MNLRIMFLFVLLLLAACGDPNYSGPVPKTCIFPVVSSTTQEGVR